MKEHTKRYLVHTEKTSHCVPSSTISESLTAEREQVQKIFWTCSLSAVSNSNVSDTYSDTLFAIQFANRIALGIFHKT
jgi:hypothetical protein